MTNLTITATTSLSAHYTDADIKRLIQADLAQKGHVVSISDIQLQLSRGQRESSWGDYSGGGPESASDVTCTPVKYDGYRVSKTKPAS